MCLIAYGDTYHDLLANEKLSRIKIMKSTLPTKMNFSRLKPNSVGQHSN